MLEDYQGNLWFTSSRLGLFKMCKSSFSDAYFSAGLSEAVVNSTARFKGNLYFATDNGLKAVDAKSGRELKNELTRALSNVRIRCLTTASDGSMWICTKSRGLVHVRKDESLAYIGQGHHFRVCIELSDGTFAAGSGDGIAHIIHPEGDPAGHQAEEDGADQG